MTTGKQKYEAMKAKIKGEVAGEMVVEEKNGTGIVTAFEGDPELAELYQNNAMVGADNLGASLPLLKVHSTGKSNSQLEDGTEPDDGAFFYSPTKQQFETVDCHILTISRGFEAPSLEDKNRLIFNQLMSGVIVNDGLNLPFITYFTGLKLERLWNFGKEAAQYTRKRPIGIPMFALTVRLTTEKIDHAKSDKYGKAWVINFEILKEHNGYPSLVTDKGKFQFLLENVATVEDMIQQIIASKSSEDGFEQVEGEPPHPAQEASIKGYEEALGGQVKEDDEDDIF